MKTESDLPYWILSLDEESKRRLEITDRRREENQLMRSEENGSCSRKE